MPESGDLAGYLDRYCQAQFVDRLQSEFPQRCSRMTSQDIQNLVNEGYEDARSLEIVEPQDIYRFLKLYFLPEVLLESNVLCGVLRRILNNMAISGTGRMDLIDRALQGRISPSAQIA